MKPMKAVGDVCVEEAGKAADGEGENKTSSDTHRKEEYTVLSEKEKLVAITIASLVTFLSPVSSCIYFPSLGPLSRDLNVSTSQINLTITAYMVRYSSGATVGILMATGNTQIAQAIAPVLTASFSDLRGRRPVFVVCLAIYVVISIGLALQSSFPALTALRCLQSLGSSGITVIASATTADVITRAERGKYMAYTAWGYTIGPAVGPIIGGILTKFLGWRSIFWFLAIAAGVILLAILGFLHETCRVVVGDGSVPPQPWNRPVIALISPRNRTSPNKQTLVTFRRKPGVFTSVALVTKKPFGLLILFGTVLFSGSMVQLSCIPALFESKYNFDPLQVGLAYIPVAVGGLTARWTCGTLADRNFRRHGRFAGVEIARNQQFKDSLLEIPLERARLQILLPMAYLWCIWMIAYSWLIDRDVHMAAPLVTLFFLGNASTGTSNILCMLIIDLHSHQPATAMAALNLFRFAFGAGAVAAGVPLIQAVGIGWMGTAFALLALIASPALWLVYFHGHEWRRSKRNGQGAT